MKLQIVQEQIHGPALGLQKKREKTEFRSSGKIDTALISSASAEIPTAAQILGEAMAKIAKTADRKKVMDTSKSTDCPKCGKPTRIVKRLKDRERNIPGGIYISCSGCEFCEKL